jgi:hypothetical protein
MTKVEDRGAKPPEQGPRLPLTLKESGEGGGLAGTPAPLSVPTAVSMREVKAIPDEAAIPVNGICARLDDMRTYLHGKQDRVYVFATLLSNRIRDRGYISPDGFVRATDDLAFILAGGGYGCQAEAKMSGLMDQSPEKFNEIVTSVIDAACPPDFAEQVLRTRKPFTEPAYKK